MKHTPSAVTFFPAKGQTLPDGNGAPGNTPVKAEEKNIASILFLVKEKSGSNTDTILLLGLDSESTGITVLSIPRDTYYAPIHDDIKKINSVYGSEGPERTMNAIGELLTVKPDYYFHINLKTFREIIDLLDGVDFHVPVDLDYEDPTQDLHIHLKKGMQHLDGDKAEQLLRFRKTQNGKFKGEISKYYDGSDLKREEMQKKLVFALIKQKMNLSGLPKINKILDVIAKNAETDIPLSLLVQYSQKMISIKTDDIQWFQLPGESKKTDYWYFIPDEKEAGKIIEKYFY